MDEPFISQISSKRVRGSEPTYYVRVPREWAEGMQRKDVRHVVVADQGMQLVLTPLSDKNVAEYRTQKRREHNRRRARERYRATTVPPSERIVVSDVDRQLLG